MPEKSERLLAILEGVLAAPATNLKMALTYVADLAADALGAEKVDVFIHDVARNSLVAVGTSTQPLSEKQKSLGLDVLPIANGGRAVEVFISGKSFLNGHVETDPDELRGIRDALAIRSHLAVPVEVAESRRGVLLFASRRPDVWSEADIRFAETLARWMGMVAHRTELVEAVTRSAAEQGRRAMAEELMTVLAHDLRNYISPIDFRLKVLQRRIAHEGRDDETRELALVLKSVARLTALVSEILDVAHLDHGGLLVRPEPFDLGRLTSEVASIMATPDHAIDVRAGASPLMVNADPQLTRQCLANVLANAVQHSPHQAPVTVLVGHESRDGGEWITVSISDEGAGIPAELLPRVFDRFVSGGHAGGLGLGLYLAKRIASAQGGELTVVSPPGKGAQFALSLPAVREPAS